MLERLQKIISAAGVTSRRAAEELITEGRVRVNGKVVTELGTKADASRDHIKVDGKLINPRQQPTYIMLNKPAGFVTTMSDPEGRPTVQDLLKGVKTRVYPVGRLDFNTEGLLLLTNDGDFAHLITHPKHEFPKTYLAKVKGVLDDRQIELLEKGMFLQDGKTAPAKVKKVRKEEANSWVEITIHEGRKRQVRRMFDHVGRSVIKLKRVRTGGLSLGDLAEGSFRHLTSAEVKGLLEAALKSDEGGLQPGAARPEQRAQPAEERVPKPGRPARRTDSRVEARYEKKAHRGRTPDLRPWRREDVRGKGPGGAASRGDRGPRAGSFLPRGDKRSRPAFGAATSRSTMGTATGRPSAGTQAWKSDARRKPGQGGRPNVRSGDSRSGFGRGPQGEVRRPSSRPRPNKSTYTGSKGPARGAKPGSKGRRQGASNRGPRR
jgi:23S rRNA pseudouridine2605 synthase